MTINNNWHTVFTFEDGIKVTFGSSVSRDWMLFASQMIVEEERKNIRKNKGRRRQLQN